MFADAIAAYAHNVTILLLAAVLFAEFILCGSAIDAPRVRLLSKLDLLYLGAAIAVLTSGTARVLVSSKGTAFYLHNPLFYLKVGLFLLIGLISALPTIRFLGWKNGLKTGALPTNDVTLRVRHMIGLQLGLLLCPPLLASLMARGFGD